MAASTTGTLHDLFARAERTAQAEGYYSAGKHRELRWQTISFCGPKHASHPHWLNDGGRPICGVCHPPARPEEVVWL